MRILVLLFTAQACTSGDAGADIGIVVGHLENTALIETSGLARSNLYTDRFWAINDGSQGPLLYAIGADGSHRGAVRVAGAQNDDWEDIASFKMGGRALLLIADIGDNLAKRDNIILYVVSEPDVERSLADVSVEVAIEAEYPDGPRDAESVAIDVRNRKILILSKRDVPAVMYELPLPDLQSSDVIKATLLALGPVDSLPQPTRSDRDNALRLQDWHWQPSAMDMSPAGDNTVIMTYRGLYFYSRRNDEDLIETLQRPPRAISLGNIKDAEGVAFNADGTAVFVTSEGKHPALARFSLIQQQESR